MLTYVLCTQLKTKERQNENQMNAVLQKSLSFTNFTISSHPSLQNEFQKKKSKEKSTPDTKVDTVPPTTIQLSGISLSLKTNTIDIENSCYTTSSEESDIEECPLTSPPPPQNIKFVPPPSQLLPPLYPSVCKNTIFTPESIHRDTILLMISSLFGYLSQQEVLIMNRQLTQRVFVSKFVIDFANCTRDFSLFHLYMMKVYRTSNPLSLRPNHHPIIIKKSDMDKTQFNIQLHQYDIECQMEWKEKLIHEFSLTEEEQSFIDLLIQTHNLLVSYLIHLQFVSSSSEFLGYFEYALNVYRGFDDLCSLSTRTSSFDTQLKSYIEKKQIDHDHYDLLATIFPVDDTLQGAWDCYLETKEDSDFIDMLHQVYRFNVKNLNDGCIRSTLFMLINDLYYHNMIDKQSAFDLKKICMKPTKLTYILYTYYLQNKSLESLNTRLKTLLSFMYMLSELIGKEQSKNVFTPPVLPSDTDKIEEIIAKQNIVIRLLYQQQYRFFMAIVCVFFRVHFLG